MTNIIVAHRGGKEFFHENTLKAYNKAIELKCPFFELDIRETKDKQIVCFHDPDIQNQKIENITYKELLDLSGIEVPLFKDALNLTKGKIKLLCEIKAKGYEKETIALLKENFNDDVVIVSFLDEVLLKVHKLDPEIKTGLIIGKKGFFNILKDLMLFFRLRKCKAKYLMLNFNYIKFGIAKISSMLRIKVFTWTVDDPEKIIKYIKNKNIYGVITNKPKMALRLISASSNRK